jgi:putative endonuclease
MEHEYWTYIVASRTGTLYIGMTNNIERRAWEHKSGKFDGFAREYHCDRLVYYEAFENVLDAIAWEKQLKGWRRSKKIVLIEAHNPRWVDLAEKWGWQMALPGESIKGR